MVAIKNLSIASAVILSVADQGLAAPIHTRAPKGTKTGLAHHALSVAGHVGAAFAGRDVEERDIEERSPKNGVKTGLAKHAMTVAGHVGAAFAGRDVDELDERDFYDELDERDFDDDVYELATRSPKGTKTGLAHHALSVAGKVGAAFAGARRDFDDEELVARALEELDERDIMDIYARYFDDAEDFEY
jgi:uncharacterized protein YcfJ